MANPEEKYGDSSLGAVPGKEAKVQETKEPEDDDDDDNDVAPMDAKTVIRNNDGVARMDAQTITHVAQDMSVTDQRQQEEAIPEMPPPPASPRGMEGIQHYTRAKELIEQIEAIRTKWSPHSAMWPLYFTRDIQRFLSDTSAAFYDVTEFHRRDFVQGVIRETHDFIKTVLQDPDKPTPLLTDKVLDLVLKKAEVPPLNNDALRKRIFALHVREDKNQAKRNVDFIPTMEYVSWVDRWFERAMQPARALVAAPTNAAEPHGIRAFGDELYQRAVLFGFMVAGRLALPITDMIYGHHIVKHDNDNGGGTSTLTASIEDPQERAKQEEKWTRQASTDLNKFIQVAQYQDNRPQRQIAVINALFTLYTPLLAESVQAESFFVTRYFGSAKPDIVTWFFSSPEVLSIFVGLCASEMAIRMLNAPVLDKTDKAYKASVAQRNLEWWTGQSNQYRFIVKTRMVMSGDDKMVLSSP